MKSVVAKVQLGEADAGIVYRSDVTPAVARYVRVFEIPDEYNVIADLSRSRSLKSAGNRRGGPAVRGPGAKRRRAEGAAAARPAPRRGRRAGAPPLTYRSASPRRPAPRATFALVAIARRCSPVCCWCCWVSRSLSLVLRISPGALLERLREPLVLQALRLSLITSLAATARRRRARTAGGVPARDARVPRASGLLEVLIDLPMVLPPTVAGVALLTAFGRNGLAGHALGRAGHHAALHDAGRRRGAGVRRGAVLHRRRAGRLHGGGSEIPRCRRDPARVARRAPFSAVLAPLAAPGLLAGAATGWARALGEFGATITFAGNMPGDHPDDAARRVPRAAERRRGGHRALGPAAACSRSPSCSPSGSAPRGSPRWSHRARRPPR